MVSSKVKVKLVHIKQATNRQIVFYVCISNQRLQYCNIYTHIELVKDIFNFILCTEAVSREVIQSQRLEKEDKSGKDTAI